MAYVNPDFKSKKALKEAIAKNERIEVYQPGLGDVPFNGQISLEGPHYPKPHTWYGIGQMQDGKLVSIK